MLLSFFSHSDDPFGGSRQYLFVLSQMSGMSNGTRKTFAGCNFYNS